MGVVYRAWDPRLQCIDAIKLVSEDKIPDEAARRQLEQEARIAISLDHPNICRIKNFVDEPSQAGIVMEFVEGQVLTNVIPAGVGLPFELVVAYGIEISRAVSCAHEHGVIHRDLKSGNVMVTRDGHIKLLDFGLSKIQRRVEIPSALETLDSKQSSEAIAGTPPYWPPEVLKRCPSDERGDIWSLGVLLYEMASGQMPFKGATIVELGSAILREPPLPLPAHLPEPLSNIIHHCLRKEVSQRYQQVNEIRAALEAIEPGGPAPGRPVAPSRPAAIRSVAVLPLENLSGSPDQEYFADGLTESLITALAKVGGLRVISRTSTMRYKHAQKTLPQIARELNVDAVVEGSVRREGDRVRITAELIDGRTDEHLWTESYDRDLRDILSLQSQVASAIAAEILAKLQTSSELLAPDADRDSDNSDLHPSLWETAEVDPDILTPTAPVNPRAFDLYLKGRYLWNNQVTDEDFRKAVEYYQRAIEIDPGSALTYSGLAHCLLLMGTGEYGLKAPNEIMPKAKEAALKSLSIDDTNAEAHLSLAMVKFRFDWDWEGAEKEFRRALELNQGYSGTHYWYSTYLAVLGRFEEAFFEAKTARQLSPLSAVMHFSLGLLLYASGQNEEAIEQLRETAAMDAKWPLSHLVLGLTFGRKGRFDEAIDEYKQALTIAGSRPLWSGFLGQVYAAAGRTDDALDILHELRAVAKQRYVPPTAFVILYAGLGMIDDAFHWLDRAVEQRDGLLIYLKVGSVFDNLRSDRRFTEILARVGLQGDPVLDVKHPLLIEPIRKRFRKKLKPVSPRSVLTIFATLLLGAGVLYALYWIVPPTRMILALQQFKTPGADPEARRLAAIMTEEMFTRLSDLHARRLGVVELTPADSELSFQQTCERSDPKPTYVLAGAVRAEGNNLVITDQLVLCKDQTGIVGDEHEIDPKAPIGPPVNDIVRKVLAALPNNVQREHPVDPKAYEAYINGRILWNQRNTQSLTQAISYFQKAIDYDATYAPSYAGLADCYALLGSVPNTAMPPNEAFPKAKANAQKALELDEGLAEAHASLGYSALVYDWNYAESEKEFKRALELRPDYATAHQYYAYYLTAMGDLNQAIAERKAALKIEPTSPLFNTALGEAYYQARLNKESIESSLKALSYDPKYAVAIINVGRAYEQQKMYPQALQTYQSILPFAPNDPALLALLGHLYGVSGQTAAARKIISRLQQMSTGQYIPSIYEAMVYTGLGDKDDAFLWLDKAYAERCEYLVYLPSDPMADPLRSDPRFPALLARLGLKTTMIPAIADAIR
ncbi:MAG TPA: protein kinase [Candidatus Sulfotelmatobacter sp.]|nr:protein kinase [Candidatus Sulfotelmatobacter sp.]